ncbi:hypothetical protein LG045_09725 (plasmid) [Limosilactobacillus gastricus]|uniref:Uncharacterized protein n=1 Tax=Limosilactobacillus gastricus DSM 16045 TaxID=1423749 RepID=A0A0R1V4G2_9LACO|nr:hypothetical protein [Limosilactobacillus gastricus]KRM00461.1 hypothetical protein FC60_GL001209 [Limosilactobacillus gastricus DSM 16045]QGF41352.1 hypothetical protein LG045_09725 [Limosilactobacillus gastricus]
MTKSKTVIISLYGLTIALYIAAVVCLLIPHTHYDWVIFFLFLGSLTDLYLNHYQEKHSDNPPNIYKKRNR